MPQSAARLDDIRARIDAIDAAMHDLLLERGGLIAQLQHAKGLGGPSGTSAMRPAREARMMRALAARHEGPLPLAVAERIWREIIAGFTQLQAPFRVVMTGADEAALAELGRFYFGVTTPLSFTGGAGEVLKMIAADESMAGVIVQGRATGGEAPWWVRLAGDGDQPARVVARLPFFAVHENGAPGREAYVLSRAPVEPSGADMTLVAAMGAAPAALAAAGTFGQARLVASHDQGGGTHLVEIEGCHPAQAFEARQSIRWLGGFAVAEGGAGHGA